MGLCGGPYGCQCVLSFGHQCIEDCLGWWQAELLLPHIVSYLIHLYRHRVCGGRQPNLQQRNTGRSW